MPKVLTSTTDLTREEWLALRRQGIGGSDVGAILGLSRYRTPLDVYMDKRGLSDEQEDNEAMEWGRRLEDLVAQKYAETNGVKVQRRNAIFQADAHPWMLANLDRVVVGQNKILECKTAGEFAKGQWGESGTDEVPETYLVQVAWYMAVMDAQGADLAVLIGGRNYRQYHFTRDLELEAMLINRCSRFWHDNVLAEVPPEPINATDLQTLYAQDKGEAVAADPVIEALADELKATVEEKKRIEEHADALKFQLQKFMKDAAFLVARDGSPLATWKTSKPRENFNKKGLQEAHPDIYSQFSSEGKAPRVFNLK